MKPRELLPPLFLAAALTAVVVVHDPAPTPEVAADEWTYIDPQNYREGCVTDFYTGLLICHFTLPDGSWVNMRSVTPETGARALKRTRGFRIHTETQPT